MLLVLYIAFIVLLVLTFAWAMIDTSDRSIFAWVFVLILSAVLMLSSYNIQENYVTVLNSTTIQNGTTYTAAYTNDVLSNVDQDPALFYFFMGVGAISILGGGTQIWQNLQEKKGGIV